MSEQTSPKKFQEGPHTCWMSVLRVPTLAGCQFLEGPHTCLDVMWSLFWSKLDLKMKIWPTSGRFGENCLLKLVLVCLILTQWWNKKKGFTSPLKQEKVSLWSCHKLIHKFIDRNHNNQFYLVSIIGRFTLRAFLLRSLLPTCVTVLVVLSSCELYMIWMLI